LKNISNTQIAQYINVDFLYACNEGKDDRVKFFLDHQNQLQNLGFEVDFRTFEYTPLELMLMLMPEKDWQSKYVGITLSLIDHYAEFKEHWTNYALCEACCFGNAEFFEKLFTQENSLANLDLLSTKYGLTPLQIACDRLHPNLVDLVLSLDSKFNINTQNNDGDTVLNLVCRKKRDETTVTFVKNIAELLVGTKRDPSCDINLANKFGKTPLDNACETGNKEVIEILVKSVEDAWKAEYKPEDCNLFWENAELILNKAHISNDIKNVLKPFVEKHKPSNTPANTTIIDGKLHNNSRS
jgi:ankyrin repeat protein